MSKRVLKERLERYAALSAALLGTASTADAAIQFTALDPNITLNDDLTAGPGDFLDIDMDGDGVAEFGLAHYGLGGGSSAFIYPRIPGAGIAADLEDLSVCTSPLPISTPPLAAADTISSGIYFRSSGFMFLYNYVACGRWAGIGPKHIGVRFEIGTETHYGWIRVNVPEFGSSVRIFGWGYEDVPDAPILAGDRGPCLAPQNPMSIITGTSSVKLTWESVPNVEDYGVRGKKAGSPVISNLQSADTCQVFPFLTPGTYRWRVYARCRNEFGNIENSDAAPLQSFTLPAPEGIVEPDETGIED